MLSQRVTSTWICSGGLHLWLHLSGVGNGRGHLLAQPRWAPEVDLRCSREVEAEVAKCPILSELCGEHWLRQERDQANEQRARCRSRDFLQSGDPCHRKQKPVAHPGSRYVIDRTGRRGAGLRTGSEECKDCSFQWFWPGRRRSLKLLKQAFAIF